MQKQRVWHFSQAWYLHCEQIFPFFFFNIKKYLMIAFATFIAPKLETIGLNNISASNFIIFSFMSLFMLYSGSYSWDF